MGHYILLLIKGAAMGAANVIPGVSGGTIAFVTGIYEEFIDALKSFDLKALKLASGFRIKELSDHINLPFLVALFAGIGVSLFSLGKLLDWLFGIYPTMVWSFFFGLILASVYFVSKSIKKWNPSAVAVLIIGVAAAVALALVKPAEENASFLYVALCGVVAVCSMILPGLSGSFVLILMGNYQLIMLQAVPNFNLEIILPFMVGGAIGFVALSHVISYLMHHYHDTTLSLLTGFILGSLLIIWPWKNEVYLLDATGELLLKEGQKIVQGYEWVAPSLTVANTWLAIGFALLGAITVALLEKTAARK